MFKLFIRCYFLVVISVHLIHIYRHRVLLRINVLIFLLNFGHEFSKNHQYLYYIFVNDQYFLDVILY